ncbi:MAG: rane protein-like [Deltaproteobacteria bacterium]|nr:rane protein-like [Deltaproteobacteria bacterium]
MTRSRPFSIALLAGAGILLALLAALLFLGPRLVNTKAFRDLALGEIERKTGARLSYARAEVTFLPRPRFVIRGVVLDVPGVAAGTVATLRADLELLPLLRGKVRNGNIVLEDPDFRVRIPPRPKAGKAFSMVEFEGNLSALLDTLRQAAPGTVVTVGNGRLDLSDGEKPIVSLTELNARVGFPPERLTLQVRCASRYWGTLSIASNLNPEGLRGDTRVETAGFRIRDFVDQLAPGTAPWLGETELSLRGRITSEGLRSVRAEIAGGVPALTLRRDARSRTFRVGSFKGSAEWTEKGLHAALSDLSVDDPRIRLSGELSIDRQPPSVEARVEGHGADIPSIRSALLALAGDVPGVRKTLGVVRGGTLSRFSLKTGGTSPGDLADLRKLQAGATLRDGTITVPGIDLKLLNVSGEASFSGGILTGRGLSARLGNSRVREGTLRMGIAGGDAPFHAELPADADLGELQPLLRRLVPDDRFREEIDRIHGVRGTASGRLTLGERLSSIRPAVVVTSVNLSGEYDRLPFPFSIRGGNAAYAREGISVADLRGTVGGSTFSGLTGRLDLGDTRSISIRGGAARIALGEVYPWIASFDGIRETVKPVRSAQGVVELTNLSCDGPLRGPGEWAFEAGGSVENLEVDTPLLPGPVTIPRGRFRIRPEEMAFTDVEASLLDTTFQGGARLRGYRTGVDQVAASLHGDVGAEAAKWAYARIGVPHPYAPRAPFTVTGSTFSWEKGGAVVVDATLAWPGGPDVALSLRKTPGSLVLDPLVIRDEASDARGTLHLDPGTANVTYAGTLSGSTVGKVVPVPARPGQRIRGEMEAVLDRGNLARFSARGTLEADDLAIPWKTLAPLLIRHISLSGEGRKIRVASSDLLWDNVPFSLTGTAESVGETVVADLDVSAGDINVDNLVRSIQAEAPGKPEAGAPAMAEPRENGTAKSPESSGFPVRGVLRLRAASVSHGSLTWHPVRAEADIQENKLRFAVSEANLCGLSTLGTLTLDSTGPAIDMAVSATGEEVGETMMCLSGKRIFLTGKYSTSVRLAGRGTGEALVRSLRGPGELTLKNGRINKMTFLSRIFSYLNVTELLRGKLPDLGKEGFPYRTLAVRGEAKDGKFLLGELTMDAPSMGIAATGEVDFLRREEDLQVLVSPFGTVDAVVRNTPILGYILGGTLVSIPIAVRGDMDDPKVTPLDPAAVGKGLLGLVERTFKVPAHIISPILPGG